MAYIVADRVKETTTVTGTGPATLLGAVSGYRTFASSLSIGDTCAYAIVSANASEWEVGIGTYSAANTLTRTTIQASTNSNAAVVFTAGTKDVFLSPTANTVLSDVTSTDGSVTLAKTGSIVDLSVAVAAATTNVIVQVRNTTGAALTKGTVVYINNATGQIPTVAKALATSDATSAQTLGMISADLANNSNGYVTIIGLIDDINTGAYQDGDQLYLSGTTAGTFTKVKPYAPTHLVYVGVVEYAHNVHGKIFVKVQNGYELDELHDVSAQNPNNGQTIVYNSTNQLWEKNTVSLTSGVNGTLPVANGGTGVTTATGSGSVVLSTAPTLTTATFDAGTISASTPNTITQTWNNAAVAFSGLTMNVTNVASAAASTLLDLQIGGASYFSITKSGRLYINRGNSQNYVDMPIYFGSSTSTNNAAIGGMNGELWFYGYGNQVASISVARAASAPTLQLTSSASFSWSPSGFAQSSDLILARDAANTLAQRNLTNPQTFRVYNTYTDASNYERAEMGWSGNTFYIGIGNAGTGTARRLSLSSGTGTSIAVSSTMEFQSASLVFRWYNGSTIGIGPSFSDIYFSNPNNFVSVRNGTAGQKFGVYNTFTDVNNYERLSLAWASNTCTIGLEQAGTGLPRTLNVNANALNAPALPSSATVTAATGNGTTVTYTCANTFSVGQIVSVTGLTTASLNIANMTIATVSSTQFTVTNATVGTAAATQAGTATIQSAGNSLTLTAGNGSGVGAGGNIVLQPGAQGTSGGNGKIRINDTAGVDTGFNFTRGFAGYPTLDQARLYLRAANDNNQTIEFRADTNACNISLQPTGAQVLLGGNNTNYVGIKERSNSGTLAVISSSGSVGGSLSFVSSTTAIATNTNDLALPASAFQRLNCTVASSLTGIAPVTGTGSVHVDGRMIRIYNVGAANLTLAHNNASSTAANRFFNSTGADIVLSTHQYVELIYDSTDNGRGGAGWRVSSIH